MWALDQLVFASCSNAGQLPEYVVDFADILTEVVEPFLHEAAPAAALTKPAAWLWLLPMAADEARDGQTALALRLARLLLPAYDDAGVGNVAFSPVSVHAALALAAAGARGATLDQLLAFLGAPSAAGLAAFVRRVSGRVLAVRADDGAGAGGPRVLFGGGVWANSEHGKLSAAFKDAAAKSYKSEARTINFAKKPEAAAAMINKWVKKATGNLIGSIVSRADIAADAGFVLATTVYFKAAWLEPFESSCTSPGTFHRLDGSRVEAEFMTKLDFLPLSCMDGFRVLKLPYERGQAQAGARQPALRRWWRRGGHDSAAAAAMTSPDGDHADYSMLVFLPDKPGGTSIAAMVDAITAAPARLYGLLHEAKAQRVMIQLPRFEISFDRDLAGDLRRLGLSLPFSPEAADLRGMWEEDDQRRPAFLGKVVHKAVVKVNEAGTEAAAVTGVVLVGGTPRDIVDFVVDRPFTFLIMEETSGVIVFAGHVLDPTK